MDIDTDLVSIVEQNFYQVSECSTTDQQEKYDLVLYIIPNCPYCKNVLAYLQSIHKTVKTINIRAVPSAREHLIKVGGKGQVPCLFINGVPLYESDDIITWLDKHQNEY